MSTIDTPEPPSNHEKMRDAIRQVIEQLAADVYKNLTELRDQIGDLEKLVAVSSDRVIADLNEHASICNDVQQEIVRLTAVIAAIRAGQVEAIQINGVAHDPSR